VEVDASAGYETRDVRVSLIVWALVIVAVTSILAFLSMRWMENGLKDTQSIMTNVTPPAVASEAGVKPKTFAGPKLQQDPRGDLQKLLTQQKTFLNSYGWVDHDKGIAHIPIDKAMQRVVNNGMPSWPAQTEDSTNANAKQTGK